MNSQKLTVQRVIAKIKNHKFFLFSCLCIGAAGAMVYQYLNPPVYKAQATIKSVNAALDNSRNKASSDAEAIHSRKMLEKAVNNLNLNVEYTATRLMHQQELFSNSPVEVKYTIQEKGFYSQPFDITANGSDAYTLSYNLGNVPMQREGTFGKEIDLGFIKLAVSKTSTFDESKFNGIDKYGFTVYSNAALAAKYSNKNFNTEVASENSNVIKISYADESPQKAYQLVNAVAHTYGTSESFNNDELVRANIEQINAQLSHVSDELDNSQNAITEYKIDNNIFDLPQQAGATLNTMGQLQVQKVDVDMQLAALDNMSEYLRQNRHVNSISPEYGTINDLVYTETYLKLNDKAAERQQIKEQGGDVTKVDKEIDALKDMLAESMRNTRKKLAVKQETIAAAISNTKARMSAMPEKESALQELNRNVYLYTKLYDFLIQKRAEAMVAAPVVSASSYIIEDAVIPTEPISPSPLTIWACALASAFVLGASYLFVRSQSKTKISNREELQRFTSIPFIANIENTGRAGYMQEPYMNLCTKILLMSQKQEIKMVTVTSSQQGEGKSTVAQNLARAFASLDKKVLLVDMNPVNPTLENIFDVRVENTMSDVYQNNTNLHEAINITAIPNVDLLTAGQLQKGINTLLVSTKTGNIIDEIKKLYDIVLFDTPEVSNYMDAIPLMKSSDLNLYVVKANTTSQELISQAELIKNDYQIDNMYFVLNAMTQNKNYAGTATTGRFKVLKGQQQAEAEIRLVPRMLKKAALWFY